MQVGDKIVCVNAGNFRTKWGQTKDAQRNIRWYETYTVLSLGENDGIQVKEEAGTHYHRERFVTVEQYRKMKLNKIKSKINEQ